MGGAEGSEGASGGAAGFCVVLRCRIIKPIIPLIMHHLRLPHRAYNRLYAGHLKLGVLGYEAEGDEFVTYGAGTRFGAFPFLRRRCGLGIRLGV